MPRNVIYYNDNTYPLSDVANTAYTDVIVGFLVPATDANGNWIVNPFGAGGPGGLALQNPPDPDGNLASYIQTLRSQGKNVLLSVGGSDGWFSNNASPQSAWAAAAGAPEGAEGMAEAICSMAGFYGFNGVDIDYEDGSGFDGTGGYDGAQFLVDLTQNIHARLNTPLITHAPQSPYWDPNSQWQGKYVQVWQQAGGQITWINNQFYNQDAPYNDPVAYYPQIANVVPPEQLLVGALLSPNGGTGYIGPDGMIGVINQLRAMPNIGSNLGGVVGWQFSDDEGYQNGTWSGQIAQALGLMPSALVTRPPRTATFRRAT